MKIKNIFINFLLIFVPLILIEIISSLIILNYEKRIGILFSLFSFKKIDQINYEINWDKKSNKVVPGKYKIKLDDGKINEYTINSKGFRNKEFKVIKNSKYRIISFGGSSTMGLESPDSLTYPAQLEKKLNENNFDVEVLNFGFSSKSLNFIRELFLSEATKYKPDFISIYSARNSIMYDSIGTKINIKKIEYPKLNKINSFLINNIMSFRLMFKTYKKILSMNINSEKIISPYDNKIEHNIYYFEEQYLKTLQQIIDYADKLKIRVILIKQAIYIDPKLQNELKSKTVVELIDLLKNIRQGQNFNKDYSDIFWIITIAILNKQLDYFANSNNVIIIDPTNILSTDADNFTDYLHLTIKGNRVLSNEIFKKIKDYLN